MFSSRFTILLAFILFIPLVLRLFKAEPYPAVLLPSYATTISDADTITVETTRLYGVISGGVWKELDRSEFFDPIPLEHSSQLLASRLALMSQFQGTLPAEEPTLSPTTVLETLCR